MIDLFIFLAGLGCGFWLRGRQVELRSCIGLQQPRDRLAAMPPRPSRGPRRDRRQRIRRALRLARRGDVLSLQQLADVWGTTKTNFCNELRHIERHFGMPEPSKGPDQAHFYPAGAALRAMLAYEQREDEIRAALAGDAQR